jgi:hypothetical protein
MELGKSDLKNRVENAGKKRSPSEYKTTGKIGGVQRTHVLKKRRSVVHTLYKPLTYSTLGKKGKPGLCEGLSRIRGKGTKGREGGGGKKEE